MFPVLETLMAESTSSQSHSFQPFLMASLELLCRPKKRASHKMAEQAF